METKQEVKTIQVDYKCPIEGCDGYLRPTGVCFPTNPPNYPHMCSNSATCSFGMTFPHTYPYLDYVPKEESR